VNATAPIVLTLSPVPLKATFRGISCVTADCVSKSTLRVAIDSVLGHSLEGVYYWPSFEIVKWLGPHVPWPAYGSAEKDSRHVAQYLVAHIIDAFVEAFYTPAAVAELRAGSGRLSANEPLPEPVLRLGSDRAPFESKKTRGRLRALRRREP